jgi:diaminopimelate decarboxylase
MLELFPDTARIEDGELTIGGVRASALAEEHGTPLVVYCEETVRGAGRAWRRGGGDAVVVYGSKAFPNVALMRVLADEGIGADVSTLGELRVAQAAGVPPSLLVVHGNNKSDEELAAAAEADAWLVVMDEPGEVERCIAAGVPRVLLRITPGVEADTHEKIRTGHAGSKFGVAPEETHAIVERARTAGLQVLGLHVHLGSQVVDTNAVGAAVETLAGLCVDARAQLDWTPAIVNLGGGLGIRYVLGEPEPAGPEEYARTVSEQFSAVWSEAGLPQPQLVFEPGRSLVGRAGVTLYRVGVVKRSGATTWVAVDGGMSDNPRPALYGARYSALLANRADEAPAGTYAVCGKHCESGDVLIDGAELPEPRRTDLLAVAATGAYTLAMASTYNAVQRPGAVLVGEGRSAVILERSRLSGFEPVEPP